MCRPRKPPTPSLIDYQRIDQIEPVANVAVEGQQAVRVATSGVLQTCVVALEAKQQDGAGASGKRQVRERINSRAEVEGVEPDGDEAEHEACPQSQVCDPPRIVQMNAMDTDKHREQRTIG